MKHIWVTGGGGFIGSNLVLRLQEEFPGASLTVLDDFRSGSFLNLEGYRGILWRRTSPYWTGRPSFGEKAGCDVSLSLDYRHDVAGSEDPDS